MTVASILRKLPMRREELDRGLEILTLKRRAWREHGQAVIDPTDDRLERIGTRLYGPSAKLQARNPGPRLVE